MSGLCYAILLIVSRTSIAAGFGLGPLISKDVHWLSFAGVRFRFLVGESPYEQAAEFNKMSLASSTTQDIRVTVALDAVRTVEKVAADSAVTDAAARFFSELATPAVIGKATKCQTKLVSDLGNATFNRIQTEGRVLDEALPGTVIPIRGAFAIDTPTLSSLSLAFQRFTNHLKGAKSSKDFGLAHDAFDNDFAPAAEAAGIGIRSSEAPGLAHEYGLRLNSAFGLKQGAIVDLNTAEGMRAVLAEHQGTQFGDALDFMSSPSPGMQQGIVTQEVRRKFYERAYERSHAPTRGSDPDSRSDFLALLDPGIVAAAKEGARPIVPMKLFVHVPERLESSQYFDQQPSRIATTADARTEEALHLFQALNEGPLTKRGLAMHDSALAEPNKIPLVDGKPYKDANHFAFENEIHLAARDLGIKLHDYTAHAYNRTQF